MDLNSIIAVKPAKAELRSVHYKQFGNDSLCLIGVRQMLDWQWIPVIGLIALSFLVLGKRVYQLYLASQDSDAPVACGGCKGCPSSPNKVTIVELKPKSRPST